ncbi:MAG: cell division protein ZapA [Sphingobium sp.]|jgi:cell division protein ZapA|nr:cell division protein ZapA [Sphingobium sp.]MCI1270261.1 cell division protein ZapA [Sphingobium sp.]MCI1754528.1 cell division protein ZapA [Sphingobium sp.]MCI2051967.1 cell division protein ZapA [Sphingobium sp.]
MAEVTLDIGGRLYDVHCRDGEERQLQRLAAIIDDKTKVARRASAGLTEVRQLLFAAILLADELDELHAKGKAQGTFDLSPASGAADDHAAAERLNHLAARIESLAQKLAD